MVYSFVIDARSAAGVAAAACYSCLESVVSGEVLEGVARDLHLRPQRDFGRN